MNIWISIALVVAVSAMGHEWGWNWGFFTFGVGAYFAEMADKFIEAYNDSFEEDHFGQ